MIQDRNRLEHSSEHRVALDCIETAIYSTAPETVTRSAVAIEDETLSILGDDYNLTEYTNILVIGGGKAVGGVSRTLESLLDNRIIDGLIISKTPVNTSLVETVVGSHPIPSETNVTTTEAILELADSANEDTLILFVLTGGASALLTSPAGDLSLADLQTTTEHLLKGGVPIGEINAVRKHCSGAKGGLLARRAAPADIAGLLLSDVVGNDLSTIGSGPTVPDQTTFADARAVFDSYGIDPPSAVANHLDAGVAGRADETPSPDDPAFDTVQNFLISDNATALDAAQSVAQDAGYKTLYLSARLQGETREVAKTIVAIGEEIQLTGNPIEPPAIILAGGESTVTVSDGDGSGGPNQELVLSGAIELSEPGVLAAIDTDGEDGSSDAAGSIIDSMSVTDVVRARDHLARNDAGTYLRNRDAIIETGPTGTNVNDIMVLVVPDK